MTLTRNAADRLRELIAKQDWDTVLGDNPTVIETCVRIFTLGFEAGYETGWTAGVGQGVQSGIQARITKVHTWRDLARELAECDLTDWEESFVSGFLERGFATPTDKQRAVFARMADEHGLECP